MGIWKYGQTEQTAQGYGNVDFSGTGWNTGAEVRSAVWLAAAVLAGWDWEGRGRQDAAGSSLFFVFHKIIIFSDIF